MITVKLYSALPFIYEKKKGFYNSETGVPLECGGGVTVRDICGILDIPINNVAFYSLHGKAQTDMDASVGDEEELCLFSPPPAGG